ncbi:MAG: ABC transporter ATP-binding protein [Candidatus Electrothrix sp. MAN1_4]|nr:ABC transporter ATP-binding protein [Candidatus Electrothrix sp. MAN1_4]
MKLRVKDLTFAYGDLAIIKNICLDLGTSEILGIVGPNGSGKSTLIRCIDKILEPTKGSILLNQREIRHMKQREVAKHLGYVPQSAPRAFPITVFDTVLMGRRPHLGWNSGETDRKKVVDALERLGIEHLAIRDFNEISGGEQQRVLIARALAQDTSVLLLDEPTSNLDIRHQLEVMELLRDLVVEKALSAIIAIHDLSLASRYTDQVVMMKKGRIFATGSPVSVFTPKNIACVYEVETVVKKDNGNLYILPKRPLSRPSSCREAEPMA